MTKLCNIALSAGLAALLAAPQLARAYPGDPATPLYNYLSRPAAFTTNFAFNAANYSASQDVGGVITVPCPGGANSWVAVTNLALIAHGGSGSTPTAGNLNYWLANANPTSSTITDGSTLVIAQADAAKFLASASLPGSTTSSSPALIEWTSGTTAASPAMSFPSTCDSSGNLYLVLSANAAISIASPSSPKVYLTVGLRY